MTPKWLKLIFSCIKEHTSHQARASGNKSLTSSDQMVRRGTQVNARIKDHPYKKKCDPSQAHQRRDRCSMCGDSKHIEGFKHPEREYQCKNRKRYGHFTSLCYRRSESSKSRTPQAHQLQAGLLCMQEDSICGQSGDLTSSDESFCLQVQIQGTKASAKFPTPHDLITNLEYQLKPHHKRNQYLNTTLDTCANVNIMPASVYKYMFQTLIVRSLHLVVSLR